MNYIDVMEAIKHIQEIKADDEMAHSEEDVLYFDLLKSIADGSCEDPKACAALAITTEEIKFARWCA